MKNCIRRLRMTRHWSQLELAARLGVSRQTVNSIEREKQAPTLELALRMGRLFEQPVEMIFTAEPATPAENYPVPSRLRYPATTSRRALGVSPIVRVVAA